MECAAGNAGSNTAGDCHLTGWRSALAQFLGPGYRGKASSSGLDSGAEAARSSGT